jgi:signal transduction histidine kinase
MPNAFQSKNSQLSFKTLASVKFPLLFLLLIFQSTLIFSEENSAYSNKLPVIEADEDIGVIHTPEYSQVFVDHQSQLSLKEVIELNQFKDLEFGRVRNFKESDTYWYRFSIYNKHNKNLDLVFKTKNRNIVDAQFFQLEPKFLNSSQSFDDAALESVVVDFWAFGDSYAFKDRPIRARKYSIAFRIPAETEQHFYLRWQDKGQALIEMEVLSLADFFGEQMITQAYFFLILGFAFGVLVYNLSIFWRTRDQLYLSYVIYIASFILFLETQNGSIAAIWPKFVSPDIRAVFVWTSAFLVMFSAARFTSQILLLRERDPEKDSWFKALQLFSLFFALSSFFAPFQAVEYAAYIMSVATVGSCVSTAFLIYRRYNDNAAKIYLYSFAPIAICIFIVVSVYAFELFGFPFMDELLRLAFCLNLIILSSSLANQISVMTEKQRMYEGKLIAAKASEKAKSDFFGKMSHEIRTPLNGVIGVTELLKDSDLSETDRKYVDVLTASSRALMHLVNNIVDFSQVESGKLKIEDTNFDLQDMLLDIEKVFIMRILESGVPLLFEIDQSLSRMYYGDVNRIRQILINLLGNAYKFTSKGIVKVKIEQLINDKRWPNEKSFSFEVIDTGIGIPPAQVESIFEDFTQVYSANQHKYEGAGLGLAICRELSKLLRGEIKLYSQLDNGSVFKLEIPLKVIEGSSNDNIEKTFRFQKNNALSSRSLLIIDSCVDCCEIVSEASTQWGMKVGAVIDLVSALANARRSSEVGIPLDLVLVDYACLEEQKGGHHFLNALARHSATKNSVVIILVSQASVSARFASLRDQKIFIFQRQALVSRYQEAFVAAINRDESFFENNKPLLQESLDELIEKSTDENFN